MSDVDDEILYGIKNLVMKNNIFVSLTRATLIIENNGGIFDSKERKEIKENLIHIMDVLSNTRCILG